MTEYQFHFHDRISDIPAQEWNRLVRDNHPFLKHEFLNALEEHGCVSDRFGWIPHHLAVYHQQALVAALPLYEKHNSYGEFVFDHSWADAWQRSGKNYFPKLVSSIPYSPVTGPRFLVDPNQPADALQKSMLQAVQQFANQHGFSGWHCLFAESEQQTWFNRQIGFYTRNDCHFHWFNREYTTFDDFLSRLTAKKRKNIRQERKSLQKQNLNIRLLNGHTATEADWDHFSHFYTKTFTDKWSTPTLNAGFFKAVAKALPDQTLLVLADNSNGECIAGSLMYHSDKVLFGRHWGCIEEIKNLHFELCYYQGIEFAIQNGLQRFEPGAGGEHKIARGFEPVRTQSSHWLMPNPFSGALREFIEEEKQQVEHYCLEAQSHSPYKPLTPETKNPA